MHEYDSIVKQQLEKKPGKTRSALGNGLSYLLNLEDEIDIAPLTDGQKCLHIDVNRIITDMAQPRKKFNEKTIEELANSIRQHGMISPIIVRPSANDCYVLIAGERRLRAAKVAGLMVIPAIIRDISDSEAAECALIENIQREDLTPIEEAQGYLQLINTHVYTQERIAKVVGKSRSHVTNMLRLLDLPSEVKEMMNEGLISMGHARAMLKAEDPLGIAMSVVDKGLSVRQTEKLTNKIKAQSRHSGPQDDDTQQELSNIERMLGDRLGLDIKISKNTVTIQYSDLCDLDVIVQKLSQ